MIIEGIVTSLDETGLMNTAPMGPIVDETFTTLLLRPFQTSQTFTNLNRHRQGVFHIVDDVLLLARAALRMLESPPASRPAVQVEGRVLSDCCRWYEFRIESVDDSRERAELQARVVHTGSLRDFIGFHRARHAVLEAAILATRIPLLGREAVQVELDRLRSPVEKTASPREIEAFAFIESYVRDFTSPEDS